MKRGEANLHKPVSGLNEVSVSNLKHSASEVVNDAISIGPIAITRHRKPVAAIISWDAYERIEKDVRNLWKDI